RSEPSVEAQLWAESLDEGSFRASADDEQATVPPSHERCYLFRMTGHRDCTCDLAVGVFEISAGRSPVDMHARLGLWTAKAAQGRRQAQVDAAAGTRQSKPEKAFVRHFEYGDAGLAEAQIERSVGG